MGSCTLNTGEYEKLAFFDHYLAYFENGKRYGQVTMEDEQELVCDLSNGAISNDLH